MSDEKSPPGEPAQGSRSESKTQRPNPIPGSKPFAPGRSGNPGGMTAEHRAILDDFRDKARRYSPEAFRRLVAIIEGEPIPFDDDDERKVSGRYGVDTKDRLRALEILLDRAWGRPAQPVVGEEGAPPVGGLTSADMRQAFAQALAVAVANAKASSAGADGGSETDR